MKRKLLLLACVAAFGAPGIASAALGERHETVSSDKAVMRAAARPTVFQGNFTTHEFVTPAGTTVREFAAADGTIFAVAWEGPMLPDVRALLGNYFGKYQSTLNSAQPNRTHATVKSDELVVESTGRLRAFHGRAYLPKLLPVGVTIDQLQ